MKKFVESLKCFSAKKGHSDSEIQEEMDLFFDIQINFSYILKNLEEKSYHHESREYFRQNLSKLSEFISDARYFFMFLNDLIFNVIDDIKERHGNLFNNFSEDKGFLEFYKSNPSHSGIIYKEFRLIYHVQCTRNYIIDYLDDNFLKENLFTDVSFLNFKKSCHNFIEAIDIYFLSCERKDFLYIDHSLRCVNIHMMSIINFIEDFCLSMGSLFLFL